MRWTNDVGEVVAVCVGIIVCCTCLAVVMALAGAILLHVARP